MASFQEMSGELVRTVEQIKMKRNHLLEEMKDQTAEVAKIEAELRIMQQRRTRIYSDLTALEDERAEVKQTVQEAELTRNKILESFKNLASILKKRAI